MNTLRTFQIPAGLQRTLTRLGLFLLFTSTLYAQGPVFTRDYGLTISYEDFSDVLRRFPGMYPYDYGTLGSPVIFRPWNLNPWELRYYKDGILQNRISDGLYDSNLQPVSELDSVKYDLLRGDAAGQIEMWTRTIPADSPYTELQIREGFYNYGTVDFAHGQRLYKSSLFELTGRLVWYDGLRANTNSKFNRLRGRLHVPLGKQWNSRWTYAGSSVDFASPLRVGGGYTEREELIGNLVRSDSIATKLRPEFNMFVRRDRENWGSEFRLRETVYGWTAGVSKRAGGNAWRVWNESYLAAVKYPGAKEFQLHDISLRAEDSLYIKSVHMQMAAIVGAADSENSISESKFTPSVNAHISGQFFADKDAYFDLGTGLQFAPSPYAWSHASYDLAARPLFISPVFSDTSARFTGIYTGDPIYSESRSATEYTWKSRFGAVWRGESHLLSVYEYLIDDLDGVASGFGRNSNSVEFLREYAIGRVRDMSITMANANLPLKWGVRAQANWQLQRNASDFFRVIEQRGYSRLYFERNFFTAPLTIRSHVSYEHIGTRMGYSDKFPEGVVLRPAHVVGLRIAATIHGVTLIWGTENFLKERYEIMPGYPMIGKEEYLAFQWRLWL